MREPEHQFVEMDAEKLAAGLAADYEKATGQRVRAASPERMLIQWLANILVQERALLNYTGNQNIPSRAEGENLAPLAQLFVPPGRPRAPAAGCPPPFPL